MRRDARSTNFRKDAIVRRDNDRDMIVGLAGIMAGSLLSMTAYDAFMTRTATAGTIPLAGHVTRSLVATLDLPGLEDNGTVSIIVRVFEDVAAFVDGCEKEKKDQD